MMGHPYENQGRESHSNIRGDKICGYREYLGVIFQLPQSNLTDLYSRVKIPGFLFLMN